MIYKDIVYGEFGVDEPVLLDIINSPEFQRLKYIDQGGHYKPHAPSIDPYYRFDHSIGVFLLLRKYNASMEEQISGLIHDLSHAVFSHCADYAMEGGSEKEHNHQDNNHIKFVKNSSVKDVLIKHGFNPDYILDDANFPLKETNLPDLCADRIDYILRTGIHYAHKNQSEMTDFLDNLVSKNGKWIFKDYKVARDFAEYFMGMDSSYFSCIESAGMFRTVSDALRYAFSKNYITAKDFYTTDREVVEKIKNHLDDPQMALLFDRMDGRVEIVNNPQNYDSRIFCKSRAVDPLFFDEEGNIKRVSDQDPDFKKKLVNYLEPKEYFLKFAR